MGQKVKVLLVGREYIIEPLGVIHLARLPQSLGCEVDVELVPENDFTKLYKRVEEWKPDFVGFSIWTGWHLQTFAACDRVREMGAQVITGGPHVTYSTDECAKHADFVVRGDGFRSFRRILQGEVGPGIHFDTEQLTEGFPMPNRGIVYDKYPILRNSAIKSIMCSVGCPFQCSYCYAPEWNEMYGGFDLIKRPVDDIIREAIEVRDCWPCKMFYMQDDIFGFDVKEWLPEFSRRWSKEVGVPFHCQLRLELTRHSSGHTRLDLLVAAGCTGITLAIESGNAFLREHVLQRAMPDELILEGCANIRSRGMTLRTEQILAVPFSNFETDLSTLDLNNRIGPEMAWTSILAPYGGTAMGDIAKNFGFYGGDNDDLAEEFFRRSVMRHSKTALHVVTPHVHEILKADKAMVEADRVAREKVQAENVIRRAANLPEMELPPPRPSKKGPLRRMFAREIAAHVREVLLIDTRDEFSRKYLSGPKPLCTFEFMNDAENDRYNDQNVIFQRLFMWLSFLPRARDVAEKYLTLPKEEWTWKRLGQVVKKHFEAIGKGEEAERWVEKLTLEFGCSSLSELPEVVRDNPYYFVFFPSSAEFAKHVVASGVVREDAEPGYQFDELGRVARHWLFAKSLYKVEESTEPIAA